MVWTVLGFEKNKRYFEKLLAEGSLMHAYLFSGQEMIGKRTFAFDVARAANNFPGVPANDPDLMVLDSSSGWGIERVRDLQKFLSLRPYAGKYRVAIIDEAEKLGSEAGNALLKTLEEPPTSALILLITSLGRGLLSTIVSRTLEIKFSPHPREQLVSYLEKINLSKKQAEFLAQFSNGRLGLAYRLQENDGFKNIRKHLEQFNDLIRVNYHTRLVFAEKLFLPASRQGGKEQADAQALLLNWMFYLRSDFSKGLKINRVRLLRKILETTMILAKPQYNHRLALENLLLWIPTLSEN